MLDLCETPNHQAIANIVHCYVVCVDAKMVSRSILVMRLECWFLDTEVDCSNPGISMLCPCARHFISIALVDSAVK